MSRSIDYATAGLAKILDSVAQCFTPEVAKRVAELRADPAVQARIEELRTSIKKTTRVIEEELIRRALKETGGNRTNAAKILEISHRALLYKIKEFGIEGL